MNNLDKAQLFDNLLLCTGAQKAGTSWLHRVLSESEEIEFSRRKELHYWDMLAKLNDQLPQHYLKRIAAEFGLTRDDYVRKLKGGERKALAGIRSVLDDDWYRKQFVEDRKYCADFTPEYGLLAQRDFRHVKKLTRNIRVIFIMRDPVERTLSAFRYYNQNRGLDIQSLSNSQIIKSLQGWRYTSHSDYLSTIDTLNKSFSSEEVLYLFYENVMASKPASIIRICEFLDIPLVQVPTTVLKNKVNASKSESFDSEIYRFLEDSYREQKNEMRDIFEDTPSTWFENSHSL